MITIDRIWNRLSANTLTSPESKAMYRIILGIWILLINFETFEWIGELPNFLMKEFYLSIPNLIRQYPGKSVFMTLDIIRLVTVVGLIIGVKSRIMGIVFVFFTVVSKSYQYTLGSIEHDFVLMAMLLIMSFSNWGTRLALIPDKQVSANYVSYLQAMIAIVITWGMFTAGFLKALIWVDFDLSTSGFMRWYTSGYYALERNRFLAPYIMDWNWIITEFFDYAAVFFELSVVFFLAVSRKSWKIWIIMALVFHLANIFLLNINSYVLPILYACFIDWQFLIRPLKLFWQRFKYYLLIILTLVISFRIIEIFSSNGYWNIFLHLSKDYYYLHLWFGIVINTILLALLVREVSQKEARK